jgi:mRNA interferase RelE/StbE
VKTSFRASFARDLKKIGDLRVLEQVRRSIEAVEKATELQEIGGLKKMSGGGAYYRIRIGDWRVGVAVVGDEVEFVRCLHRRDIYRYFP